MPALTQAMRALVDSSRCFVCEKRKAQATGERAGGLGHRSWHVRRLGFGEDHEGDNPAGDRVAEGHDEERVRAGPPGVGRGVVRHFVDDGGNAAREDRGDDPRGDDT